MGVDEVLRGGSLGYFIGLIRAGGGEDYYLFDDILYKERYSIERTNAWLDSYRSLLNRFDVTLISWQAWNYIAFIVILMKKVKKNQKSR